jgi:hypothetical protein
MQQQNAAAQISASTVLGGMPKEGAPLPVPCKSRNCGGLRRRLQEQGDDRDGDKEDDRKPDHCHPPAMRRHCLLEQGRPHHAGDVLPGRDQRQRSAAAPVEPAADIDEERRIQRAIAEKADKQPVPDQDRPDVAAGRNAEAGRDHHRAENHGKANAEPVRHLPHHDAAEARTQPRNGSGERDDLASRAKILGDWLQPDDGEQRRPVGDRQQTQRDAGRDPRLARFDAIATLRCGNGSRRRCDSDYFRHRAPSVAACPLLSSRYRS